MNGKVVVRSGGSLTIDAGTIVKSESAQGVDATALILLVEQQSMPMELLTVQLSLQM